MATAPMQHLILDGHTWLVKVRVPAALVPLIGKSTLSRTTGQQDPHKAALVAKPIRAEFQSMIAKARAGQQPDIKQAKVNAVAASWRAMGGDPSDISEIIAFVLKQIAKEPWSPEAHDGPYRDAPATNDGRGERAVDPIHKKNGGAATSFAPITYVDQQKAGKPPNPAANITQIADLRSAALAGEDLPLADLIVMAAYIQRRIEELCHTNTIASEPVAEPSNRTGKTISRQPLVEVQRFVPGHSTANPARLLQIAARALAEVNADMTLRSVVMLTAVALEGGKTVGHYVNATGMPLSTASRLLLDLSDGTRAVHREGGAGLLDRQVNITNRREVNYGLSTTGRALFDRMTMRMAREG